MSPEFQIHDICHVIFIDSSIGAADGSSFADPNRVDLSILIDVPD